MSRRNCDPLVLYGPRESAFTFWWDLQNKIQDMGDQAVVLVPAVAQGNPPLVPPIRVTPQNIPANPPANPPQIDDILVRTVWVPNLDAVLRIRGMRRVGDRTTFENEPVRVWRNARDESVRIKTRQVKLLITRMLETTQDIYVNCEVNGVLVKDHVLTLEDLENTREEGRPQRGDGRPIPAEAQLPTMGAQRLEDAVLTLNMVLTSLREQLAELQSEVRALRVQNNRLAHTVEELESQQEW